MRLVKCLLQYLRGSTPGGTVGATVCTNRRKPVFRAHSRPPASRVAQVAICPLKGSVKVRPLKTGQLTMTRHVPDAGVATLTVVVVFVSE